MFTGELARQVELKEQLGQATVSALNIYPIKSCAGVAVDRVDIVPTGFRHDRELMLVFPSGRFISQRDKGAERLTMVTPQFVEDDIVRVSAPGMPDLHVPVTHEGETTDVSVHKTTDIKVVSQGKDADKWFEEYLGIECRLVAMSSDYQRQASQRWALRETDIVSLQDGYNELLISQESLDDLNRRLTVPLPMNRFRPNIVIKGNGIAYGEDQMQQVRINDVTFDVVKPCMRCVITTTRQEDGARGKYLPPEMRGEPLVTLATYRSTTLQTGDKGVIFGQNLINIDTGTIGIGDKISVLATQPPPLTGSAKVA